MANISYKPTAGLQITGITPDAGPKPTITVAASSNGASYEAGDYLADTYTVNASTTATVINLGKIVTGKFLWIETNGELVVTITQAAAPRDIKVNGLMILASPTAPFTAISVANPSSATAVKMSLVVAGDRDAVGTGPGVF